eukprot:gene12995-biopygen9446
MLWSGGSTCGEIEVGVITSAHLRQTSGAAMLFTAAAALLFAAIVLVVWFISRNFPTVPVGSGMMFG